MIALIYNLLQNPKKPYELDYYLVDGNKKIYALTKKNSDFIEAVIKLDSNYARESESKSPDSGFDPEINSSNSQNKYSGSAIYWFERMKTAESEDEFRKCVLGAIIAIDNSNSTHLEASVDGRKEMCNRICNKCKSYEDIIDELNKPFDGSKTEHLISILTAPIQSKGKDGYRYNLSFATKFCSYAAKHLGATNQYSKYDNVVSDALPSYVNLFLGRKEAKSTYKIKQEWRYKESNEQLLLRLALYKKYTDSINAIIIKNAPINNELTSEQLDHIIWYTFKG